MPHIQIICFSYGYYFFSRSSVVIELEIRTEPILSLRIIIYKNICQILFRCDECKLCYHFHCLDPPLRKSPKQIGYAWHCTACDLTDGDTVSTYNLYSICFACCLTCLMRHLHSSRSQSNLKPASRWYLTSNA